MSKNESSPSIEKTLTFKALNPFDTKDFRKNFNDTTNINDTFENNHL